jgi:hypothetical protein
MTDKTRYPLKDKPLRNPGQSVEERKRDLILDKMLQPLLVALVFSVFALMELARSLTNSPPMPWVWGIATLIAIGWATYRVAGTLPEIRNLNLAIEGEKAVGQYPEKLRTDGYEVFHDIVGSSFNVDHVIIGPGGVFTIETKAWRKPVNRDPKIQFDGKTLTAAGWEPDRNPVMQARAQASWLAQLLKESTGKTFPVRPVILFPGWFVEPADGAAKEVWVLNPKALPEFLQHESERMSREDVKLASYHLSRIVRAGEASPGR